MNSISDVPPEEEAFVVDDDDWRVLLLSILKQAIYDYVRLQHPKHRDQTYLVEALYSAKDFFFDEEFRLAAFRKGETDYMSLEEFLSEATNLDNVNIKKLQEHVINEAKNFWSEKYMNTIKIPDIVCIEGVIYDVIHHDSDTYYFQYEEQKLFINKTPSTHTEQEFIKALLEALCYHMDISISKSKREALANGLMRALRVNDCFR